jgi:ABC-type molybdate transport system substrate-binding protein
MTKNRFMLFWVVLVFSLAVGAGAKEPPLKVAADSTFRAALEEIAPHFSEATGCGVSLDCRGSDELADDLLAGTVADVYFPAAPGAIDRLREKGVVDVALAKNVVVLERPGEDPAYLRAVVLTGAPNRLKAMAFLDFLTSESARETFSAHGFALP